MWKIRTRLISLKQIITKLENYLCITLGFWYHSVASQTCFSLMIINVIPQKDLQNFPMIFYDIMDCQTEPQ
jgi:hypothetical protein